MAALFECFPAGPACWFGLAGLLRLLARCRRDGLVEVARADGSAQVSEAALLARLERAALVCLDDVGTRSPTDAQYDALVDVLEARRGRPLVMTGNLSPERLGDVYDGRIASRMLAGLAIELTGRDLRLERAACVTVSNGR
jgi:DNA replication protein DnaC